MLPIVINGTIDKCESKDDAYDFLQEYMMKDKNKIPDINTIHLFGNPNQSLNLYNP